MNSSGKWKNFYSIRLKSVINESNFKHKSYLKIFNISYLIILVINILVIYFVVSYVLNKFWIGSLLFGLFIIICSFIISLIFPASIATHYARHLKDRLLPIIADFFELSYQSSPDPTDINGITKDELEKFSIFPYGYNRFYSDNLFSGIYKDRSFRFSCVRTVYQSTQSRSLVIFKGVALIVDLPKKVPSTIIVTNRVKKIIKKIDLKGIKFDDEFAEFDSIDNIALPFDFNLFSDNKQIVMSLITPFFLHSIQKIKITLDKMIKYQTVRSIFAIKWLFPSPKHSDLFRIELQDSQALILLAVPVNQLFELNYGLYPINDFKAATSRVAQQLSVMIDATKEITVIT